jgi:hypothetical protein
MKTTFCEVINKHSIENNINFADTKINNAKKNNTMNKTILTIILAFTMLMTNATSNLLSSNSKTSIYSGNVISIKLKNDTDEAFSVINAGSGGSYRLSKNTVVTIKMEEGDKLYMYEGGKKGALLLVASSEMDGKVQLVSKL